MSILGLVVEYNPFHNGHLYHLEQAKKLTGASSTICVMSGNFIQRGEPAVVNKWARTKMAILSGIDLVIELPAVYSMSSAEFFAFGAVKILDSLGVVDALCFGSEEGSIDKLELIADILLREPDSYRGYLKECLSKGLSYPSSRESALNRYLNDIGTHKDLNEGTISFSNNILGIEYLKALKRLGSRIHPATITRINNTYNSEEITGNISSATSIRKSIFEKNDKTYSDILKNSIPLHSVSALNEEFENGRGPVSLHMYENLILGLLRIMSIDKIASLPYVSEGLENRLKTAAEGSGSMDELIENTCTKRYTRTRIQRILASILTGLTSAEFDEFNKHGGPQYIRILGFNKKGKEMLSKIKRTSTLPVIVKTANFKNTCNPLLKRMLEIESAATDIYVLGYSNPAFRKAGQEFTQNVVRL